MQRCIQYLQNNSSLFYYLAALVFAVIIFFGNKNEKFFGFEYEDAFISAHVSAQTQPIAFVEYFRTKGCDLRIDGKCENTFSYPGHYVPYSYYLKFVSTTLFVKESYLIHYYGNFILLLIIILPLFFLKIEREVYWFLLALMCSLPAMYVFNSGLIENLSFTLGVLLILSLKLYTRDERWILLYFLLLILITIVKRENLIYLMTLGFFNIKHLLNKKSFWIFVGLFAVIQFSINPFYTEGIESNALGKTTFSLDYLLFQLPTYLSTFYRPDGFLLITLSLLFLIKPTKSSFVFLTIWISFLVLYGLHYRSQYAINSKEITHFETFRYMFNTVPLLLGVFIFGKSRRWSYKYPIIALFMLLVGFSYYSYDKMIQEFKKDENANYHLVNDRINNEANNSTVRVSVIDNFELISMLNTQNIPIDVYSDLQFSGIKDNGRYYLINRFNLLDINQFMKDKEVRLSQIDSLSGPGGNVYLVEKR